MTEPQASRLARWTAGFLVSARAEGLSPGTLSTYRGSLSHLDQWLRQSDPVSLTTAELSAFLHSVRDVPNLRSRTLSPETICGVSDGAEVVLRGSQVISSIGIGTAYADSNVGRATCTAPVVAVATCAELVDREASHRRSGLPG